MKSLLLCLLLVGCTTAPVTKEVLREVPVPCIKERPKRPDLVTDADMATMSDYQLPLALRAYQLAAGVYITELEAVIAPCVAPGQP